MGQVAELNDFRKPLSVKEERWVENVAVHGMNYTQAARHAGFGNIAGSEIASRPHVAAALQEVREANAQTLRMTREKVLQGYLDAISQAKILGEPMTQVAAWREIAKSCGFDKPEEDKKKLSEKQSRMLKLIEEMSEEELVILAAKDVTTIDAETTEKTPEG